MSNPTAPDRSDPEYGAHLKRMANVGFKPSSKTKAIRRKAEGLKKKFGTNEFSGKARWDWSKPKK